MADLSYEDLNRTEDRLQELITSSNEAIDGHLSILNKSIAAMEKQFGIIAISIAEQAAVLEAVIGVLTDEQRDALTPLIAEQKKAMFDILNHVSDSLAQDS